MAEREVNAPEISVVIPIYNEAEILEPSVIDLVAGLEDLGVRFEILLAEKCSSSSGVKSTIDPFFWQTVLLAFTDLDGALRNRQSIEMFKILAESRQDGKAREGGSS